MIGKIPTVLKINMKINQVSCFFDQDFHNPIPFRIILRIITTINIRICACAEMPGMREEVIVAVCASII